jgi:hypothetical protein
MSELINWVIIVLAVRACDWGVRVSNACTKSFGGMRCSTPLVKQTVNGHDLPRIGVQSNVRY